MAVFIFALLFLWFFSDCPRKPKVFMMKLTLWLIFECQRKTTLASFFFLWWLCTVIPILSYSSGLSSRRLRQRYWPWAGGSLTGTPLASTTMRRASDQRGTWRLIGALLSPTGSLALIIPILCLAFWMARHEWCLDLVSGGGVGEGDEWVWGGDVLGGIGWIEGVVDRGEM